MTRGREAGRVGRALAAAALLLFACSDKDEAPPPLVGGAAAAGGSAGANGNTGGAGAGGASGASGGAGTSGFDDAPPPNCAGEVHEAKEVPVAMYIMLDRSGSMLSATGAGPTKWDATVQALSSFVQADGSSGLWVGLQYFPLAAPGVPETCQSDADCGAAGGQCLIRACMPPALGTIDFTLCVSDLDCPLVSPGCAPFGVCEQDDTLACFTPGSASGCDTLGACQTWTSECLQYASCEVGDYATPAVAIDVLPDNAQPLVDSLAAAVPRGLTPTSAALVGALEQANDFAASHPEHVTIAVLATDGTPTDCTPTDIASIAAIAQAAASAQPALRTYVIGVFAPEETAALGNLDTLAAAGGSEQALIVDPTEDVSAQFLEALDAIRAGTVGCELQLPPPPVDVSLDFNRINVELTEGDRVRQLPFVGELSSCRDADLGWYYDRELGQGQDPTRIVMCPDACDAIQEATGASVSIRLGCLTRTPD